MEPPQDGAQIVSCPAPLVRDDSTKPMSDAPMSQSSTPKIQNLDAARRGDLHLSEPERALLTRIEEKVASGKFELPQMPSTSSAVIALANDPKAEIGDIVDLISKDLTLSTDLLKMANSAAFGAKTQIETIRDAVARLGMRRLRSLIFAASMRSVMKGPKEVMDYTNELWRQSNSVAGIARAIAKADDLDPEKAFLIGLLLDVGKIPILGILSDEARKGVTLSPMLVGTAFHRFHEEAGRAMALAWNLSEEFCSVAGHHHDFATNEAYPRTAALVNLAHKLDLYLSTGEADEYRDLENYSELEFLGLDEAKANAIFDDAARVFGELHPDAQRQAA